MKKKRKSILLIIILIAIFGFITLFLPSMKSFLNQTMHKELIEKVNNDALSANIKIVQRNQETGSFTSVSAGASGVLFRKEGNKYYALTAKHVIEEAEENDQTQIIILGYDQLDFSDHLDQGGKYVGIDVYYQQFPQAKIEYANDKYDLAVISFDSNEDYAVLPISEEMPVYGDVVASMSNPHRKRNVVTAGKVNTITPRPFGDKAGDIQYPVIRHNAMISKGSSGSALLNENLEIVGINLGGGENIFRKFVHGMAMPCDRVRNFLEEWRQIIDEDTR